MYGVIKNLLGRNQIAVQFNTPPTPSTTNPSHSLQIAQSIPLIAPILFRAFAFDL